MSLHPNMAVEEINYSNDMSVDSMAPEKIESDRLEYLKIDSGSVDIGELHSLFSELDSPAEVFKLCGWEQSDNLGDTVRFVSSRERRWREKRRFEYLLRSKDSGEFIGTAYMDFSEDLTNCEIGYWLRKPYWGKELSSEIAEVFIHITFEELDANYLSVGCLETNKKSLKSIMKYVERFNGFYTGMQPVDSKIYFDSERDTLMHHEFAITSEQYSSGEEGISTSVPGIDFENIDI